MVGLHRVRTTNGVYLRSIMCLINNIYIIVLYVRNEVQYVLVLLCVFIWVYVHALRSPQAAHASQFRTGHRRCNFLHRDFRLGARYLQRGLSVKRSTSLAFHCCSAGFCALARLNGFCLAWPACLYLLAVKRCLQVWSENNANFASLQAKKNSEDSFESARYFCGCDAGFACYLILLAPFLRMRSCACCTRLMGINKCFYFSD